MSDRKKQRKNENIEKRKGGGGKKNIKLLQNPARGPANYCASVIVGTRCERSLALRIF